MRKRQQPGRCGSYYPAQIAGSPIWYLCYYSAAERRTVRESLGTEDFDAAAAECAKRHAFDVMRKAAPQDVALSRVFERYWLEHGSQAASASSIRVHLRVALELIDGDPMVSDFGHAAQEKLTRRLRAQYAPGTVKRTFASVKAAVLWAWRMEMITAHPPFIRDLPGGEPRERVLEIAELAALWDAMELAHLRAFCMVMVCTLARPSAALELTRFQCDLQRRTVDLNGGRARTKKRRPVLPMVDAFQPWVSAASPYVVSWNGRPVKKINKAWRNARELAGLGEDVVPLTIRHTMASELAGRGVPEMEIAAMLGHVMPNVRTSANYVKFRPDYLRAASDAISAVIRETAALTTRPLYVPYNPVRSSCDQAD